MRAELKKSLFTAISELKSKNVLVCGLALSGVEAAAFLARNGANVSVTDIKTAGELSDNIEKLGAFSDNINYELGTHSKEMFERQDLIIVSPGVACDSRYLKYALDSGVRVVSEVEFASWFTAAPYAAVTGTNGKTTTTTLVYEILKKSDMFDKVYIGGNIGVAFSKFAAEAGISDVSVLEISSFQMEFASSFSPRAAALLNITEDHLNRHHDMRTYIDMKMRVFQNQQKNDCAVINACDPLVMERKSDIRSRVYSFAARGPEFNDKADVFVRDGSLWLKEESGEPAEVIKTSEIGIIGLHNLANSAAAAALCRYGFGAPLEAITCVLKNFRGVRHRLEFIADIGEVSFYNDSKATNEDSTKVALASFKKPVILIAGGSDKGSDFHNFACDITASSVKKIFLIGQVREKIKEVLMRRGFNNVTAADTLEECVEKAFYEARRGDVVLLSPACASLDMFKNYEQRGDIFAACVNKLKKAHDGCTAEFDAGDRF